MNLRNYTSSVSVESSLSNIQRLLAQAGATHISTLYSSDDRHELIGVLFQINVGKLPMTFRLPSKVEIVYHHLWEDIRRPKQDTQKRIREQAARTAWKLLYDWVSIQVSMIKLEQVEAMEVFLPYAYDPQRDQTFFQRLKETGFKQLAAGKTSE